MRMSEICGRPFVAFSTIFSLSAFALSALALPAHAAPVFTDRGLVVQAAEPGPYPGGVGAPTVAWDGAQYVMFFEAPGPTVGNCAQSYYIGRATSPDGTVWTVEPQPVLGPDAADAPRACAVSQPAVVYDGATWELFVTLGGEIDQNGINTPNGIGWFTSSDGLSFTAQGQVIGTSEGIRPSMASAAKLDGQLFVLWSSYPDIYLSVRQPDGSWTSADAPVLSPTSDPASDIWVFSPALLVGDATFEAFYGADGSAGRNILLSSSPDAATWTADPGSPLSSAGLAMAELNHIDLLSAGGEYLMWYSRTDPNTGLKAIGMATSAETWTEPDNRVDTTDTGDTGATDTGDTGPADDTGTTDDTAPTADDTASDSDPADSGKGDSGKGDEGCGGCDGTGGAAIGVGMLAGLLLRRRPRRD